MHTKVSQYWVCGLPHADISRHDDIITSKILGVFEDSLSNRINIALHGAYLML